MAACNESVYQLMELTMLFCDLEKLEVGGKLNRGKSYQLDAKPEQADILRYDWSEALMTQQGKIFDQSVRF